MGADTYFDTVEERLRTARAANREALELATEVAVETITNGGVIWAFGCTHASIPAQELFFRAGGLVLINPLYAPGLVPTVRPITLSTKLERIADYGCEVVLQSDVRSGDLVIVISASGRNAVPVDVALAAKERGARVLTVLSVAYCKGVSARHPSGLKLCDVDADVVFDIGGDAGDAAVPVPGTALRTGATSNIIAMYLLNGLMVNVVTRLAETGMSPLPVFVSANVDGGDEHNARVLSHYRGRLGYL